MESIVTKFGTGFKDIVSPLTEGIKTGFSNLIYVDPAAEVKVLSDLAEVGLIVGGACAAIGLIFGMFHLVRKLMGR